MRSGVVPPTTFCAPGRHDRSGLRRGHRAHPGIRDDPVDAGQLRGVSRFAAGIVKLFLLDQYDDAELDRKKVAAMHALFITTPAPAEPLDAAEGRDENDERTLDLQPGQITMLEPGEEVQTSAPADSGQTYEPFQYRTLLQVSAALGVPYAYLSNDMLKANYFNSRLALLEFRRPYGQKIKAVGNMASYPCWRSLAGRRPLRFFGATK